MLKFVFFFLVLFVSAPSIAGCDSFYPNGKKIEVKGTKELCNSWFVTVYDERRRGPLFSSELLQGEVKVKRGRDFKADTRVKNPVRDSEYRGLGYDRGHLVPADNAINQVQMKESFLLTNAAPQAPKLNQISWRNLEQKVKKMRGKVYVLTGVVYVDNVYLNDIPLPSHFYKVIYSSSGVECWIAGNDDRSKPVKITQKKLENMIGFKL